MRPVTEEEIAAVAYGDAPSGSRRRVLKAVEQDAELQRVYEEHLQVARAASELGRIPLPDTEIALPPDEASAPLFGPRLRIAAATMAAAAAIAFAFVFWQANDTGSLPAPQQAVVPQGDPIEVRTDLQIALQVIDFGLGQGTRSLRETPVDGVATATGRGLESGLRAVRTGWRAAASPITNLFQPEPNEQT